MYYQTGGELSARANDLDSRGPQLFIELKYLTSMMDKISKYFKKIIADARCALKSTDLPLIPNERVYFFLRLTTLLSLTEIRSGKERVQ